MDFAENWDKTKARFRGFWNGEIIDRCMAAAVAPRDNARFGDFPFPSDPEGRESWWLDAERVFERQFDRIENTYYAGDAIPSISPDLGVAGHAGYFRGAGYAFGRDAIWFRPFIGGIGQGIGGLVFDRETPLFRKTAEHCKYFCERSKGRVAVAMPKASGNADALAHALGSENLLVAMLEEPEETASALEKMQSAWEAVFAEVNPVL
ncbi:MAG: hypothetical protein FWC55_09205, partial [Firmicutes bacterium]|nr:hypothetical protein [Bacillota bacterium]